MSLNPSSRGIIKAKTFDYGSADNGNRAKKEMYNYISGIKGSALIHLLVEDCCYTVHEGTEEDLKELAKEMFLESSDNSEFEYYRNGKRTSLKIEIEI